MSNPTSGRLTNKVCLVTGAGSGFGAAIARRFAAEGARVIIADMHEENGTKVAKEIHAYFVKMDVSKREDWDKALKEIEGNFGFVDVLVNNAGTSYRTKTNLETTEDEFDMVVAVNLKSIYLSSQTVIPHMVARGAGGSVVNIASIGAMRPRPGLIWYNATKAAVVNASKGLATEYGPKKIRVNSICPLLSGTGLFSTFVGVEDTPENREKFLFNVPMGRLAEPDDIANACLFYASDESTFVTGTALEVDGGRAIG